MSIPASIDDTNNAPTNSLVNAMLTDLYQVRAVKYTRVNEFVSLCLQMPTHIINIYECGKKLILLNQKCYNS